MSTTLVKTDLNKEDYVLKGLIVSDVSLFDRTKDNKQNLIFIKFVGSKRYGASPSMLYFGKEDFVTLSSLRGQKVDVLLQPSDKGFTVVEMQVL